MKSRLISRREFLNNATLAALMACLYGCTKTVTKYRPDGTPYTEEEDDWVASLAALIIFIIILGVIAANRSKEDDDEHSLNYEGNQQPLEGDKRKIWTASMVSKNDLHISGKVNKVSITDSQGRLLAIADGYANIQHKDLDAVKSLLASARISNLLKPIVIRLKQDRLDSYRIENIQYFSKSLKGKFRVVERDVDGQSYKIRIFRNSGDIVDIEIEPSNITGQNVA